MFHIRLAVVDDIGWMLDGYWMDIGKASMTSTNVGKFIC